MINPEFDPPITVDQHGQVMFNKETLGILDYHVRKVVMEILRKGDRPAMLYEEEKSWAVAPTKGHQELHIDHMRKAAENHEHAAYHHAQAAKVHEDLAAHHQDRHEHEVKRRDIEKAVEEIRKYA